MNTKKLFSLLTPVDFVSIVFLTFLVAMNALYISRVPNAVWIILVDVIVIAAILILARQATQRHTPLLTALHRWYAYPFVLFVFKEIYLMVHPINPADYDWLLISIDHWIFGVNPTQWAAQFASPALTEVLQVSYFSYYILFIMLGAELYTRYGVEQFDRGAFLIVYGFYLSYLGYFLLPAAGPRFTLHDFYAINNELPGILFTPWIRDFINAGESISFSMPDALAHVQRDVFPSGHTQLTLIVVYLSHHDKLKLRWVTTTLASLLLISTIYLRYHYVVDLAGGAIFFLFTIWSGNKIQRWWDRQSGKP